MFAVYCPAHDSRVLLFPDNIQAIINAPGGIELHWRCGCGAEGVKHFPRADRKIIGGPAGIPLQLRER
jgi:hypothetical protein